jgi:hypothetical protein
MTFALGTKAKRLKKLEFMKRSGRRFEFVDVLRARFAAVTGARGRHG